MMRTLLQSKFWIITVIIAIGIAGCFFPLVVDQPSTGTVGEKITVTIDVTIDETAGGPGGGPAGGICAVLMDTNWTISSMSYDGDYGPDGMSYLHPDSSDKRPEAGIDYWRDSIAFHFPPPAGMDWYVYQQDEDNYPYIGDTTMTTVTIEITPTTEGSHTIGYFVTSNDLMMDDPGNYAVSLENAIEVSASAIDDRGINGVVTEYGLDQNYPNPFNPSTSIRYRLPQSGQVYLSVFDVTGKEIAVLVNGVQSAGEHEVQFSAENLSSGVYLYRLTSGEQTHIRKMMLVK